MDFCTSRRNIEIIALSKKVAGVLRLTVRRVANVAPARPGCRGHGFRRSWEEDGGVQLRPRGRRTRRRAPSRPRRAGARCSATVPLPASMVLDRSCGGIPWRSAATRGRGQSDDGGIDGADASLHGQGEVNPPRTARAARTALSQSACRLRVSRRGCRFGDILPRVSIRVRAEGEPPSFQVLRQAGEFRPAARTSPMRRVRPAGGPRKAMNASGSRRLPVTSAAAGAASFLSACQASTASGL